MMAAVLLRRLGPVAARLMAALPWMAELAGAGLLVAAAWQWHHVVGLASAGVVLVAAANAKPPAPPAPPDRWVPS